MSILTSRKFRVDILTIFITIFLVSIVGITYYFYSRSNEAVLKVANGLISRTIDSITQKLDEFLQPTPLFGIANLIMNDLILDKADMLALASYMHVVLNSYPQLVNAYIADTKGNLFVENRITNQPLTNQFIPFVDKSKIPTNTKFVSEMLSQMNGIETAKFIYKNEFGMEIAKGDVKLLNFDPRNRPWFKSTKAGGKSMWIGIYPFYDMPAQVVTIAFPVYVKNQFMGVAAADLNVHSIRAAMERFSIDAKGLVFIANHSGQIIAYQDQQPDIAKTDKVSSIYTTKNPLIKKAYELHAEKNQNNFTFESDHITYIAYFKTYTISGNEKWEIAAIVPIDVFVGSINKANRKVLIFSLSTLVIGLLLVILCANRISKPIIKIAHETESMQHFNFDKVTEIKSYIYEIQVMVNALNIAKSSLLSFSKYVPRVLVEQLLKMGNIAEPGGKKKKITVLFSDIANFTTISENSDPNQLMADLSAYLNALTQRIHHHRGNIDKYIGDAIMAFWGAPQNDENQIHHACQALLDCRHEVHRLCQLSASAGKPEFMTRFGLHTGLATVGNLGSADRLNYTAIGDTVNTASRLEGINKTYGTEIIVSEDIYNAAAKNYLFRPIDVIAVKGKKRSTMIYELVAENIEGKTFPATEPQIQLCTMFTEAYRLFHLHDVKRALALFMDIAKIFPDDMPTKFYIERCKQS